MQRLLREARLASRLAHPYAAHIFAFGIEEHDRLLSPWSACRVSRSPSGAAVIADLQLPTCLRLLRPSPDGLRLVTIPSYAGKAVPPLLWDLARYRLVTPLEDQRGRTFSARYVGGGHAIVTVGADGAARLWNGETGRLLSTYRSTSLFLVDAVDAPKSLIAKGDTCVIVPG